MSNNDEITNLLTAVLIFMIIILFILIVVYVILKLKSKVPKREKEQSISKELPKTSTSVAYNKQSIFSFMNFDKIEDNMIIRNKETKFLMVVECQGVNYDLMSGIEKNSVEQGFSQFLNTLRYPIQLYVQTRTVNLESGIIRYKDRVREIEDRLIRKQLEYDKIKNLEYDENEIQKAKLELTREKNLYEYGIDIINNTERMSLNKNILRKHYYVIIAYTPEEITDSKFSKEEIKGMAFSELYTRSQSIINALAVCGVNGKILDSEELVELLYIAYNRDEAETYDLQKAINAGVQELYRTAPDVLDKRMEELRIKIEEEAYRKANEVVEQAIEESEKERAVKEKERNLDELVDRMAKRIIERNKNIVGKEIAEKAKEKIENKPQKKGRVKNEE